MPARRSTSRSSAPSRRSSQPSEISKTRVIGVLGTQATVRQPYVDDLAARFAADCTVDPPRLARAGRAGRGQARRRRRSPSRRSATPRCRCSRRRAAQDIDVIVLACTHFRLARRRAAQRLSRGRAGRRRARHRPPHRVSDPRPAVAGRDLARRRTCSPVRRQAGRCSLPCPLRPRGRAHTVTCCELFALAIRPLQQLKARGRAREALENLDYDRIFRSAIERLHDEGRYRVFIDILRTKGIVPRRPLLRRPQRAQADHRLVLERLSRHGPAPRGRRGDGNRAPRRRRRLGRHAQHRRQHPLSCRPRGRARRPARQGSRACCSPRAMCRTRRRCRRSANCFPAA